MFPQKSGSGQFSQTRRQQNGRKLNSTNSYYSSSSQNGNATGNDNNVSDDGARSSGHTTVSSLPLNVMGTQNDPEILMEDNEDNQSIEVFEEGRYRRTDGTQSPYNRQMMDEVTTLNDEDPVDDLLLDQESQYVDQDDPKFQEKYFNEQNAINDAQSVAFTAFTMNLENGQSIVNDLRHVGVTVLSLESLSTAAMVHYMNAVTTMRLGNDNDEKCMLYTDRMGRVFNVVISGGAEGLANTWVALQATFSGLAAVSALPFIARVVASFEYQGHLKNDDPNVFNTALHPTFLLFLFGLILQNETSHSWISLSINVRGSNSVASHVWRSGCVSDYPRIILLTTLTLASFASPSYPVRDVLTFSGAILGGLILLCNLGSRAWKKLNIGFIDSTNIFSPVLVTLVAIMSGLTFPFIGLQVVHGGTDGNSGATAVEKITYNSSGRRARQNVTFAAAIVAILFSMTDVQSVQNVLGFEFGKNQGVINLTVGTWWFLSTVVSLSLCHRLDISQAKKIEPFLKRDETSPVGWIVPSIPNIVIDPSLGKSMGHFPCLKFGSDLLCACIVVAMGGLIVWQGVQQILGYEGGSSVWDVV